MQANIISASLVHTHIFSDSVEDYTELLQFFNLEYKKVDYYLQVGDIKRTQGWILHLSVILSQISDMLKTIIPFLVEEKTPFKVAMNQSVGDDLLNGNLGLAQIGKIVSIYPENNLAALLLARKLIELTKSYKGPYIPTDICLENIVYTRYGSFNPVWQQDANGNQEKYIYDHTDTLIKDPYCIPFELPKCVEWPFTELANPVLPDPPKLFNRIYKVLDILKPDPRGNVFKGLYLKSLFQVKNVVLKQGFTNSASDRAGRDVRDRLLWQVELYKELSPTVPLPVIYDLIQEESYTLLVMKYINGGSLYQKAQDINPFSKSWSDLSFPESLELIYYGKEIIRITGEMHKKGFLHRDITPVNFLIDKRKQIFLIDIELAYSMRHNRPNPPFTLGTPGFMSPEQEAEQAPTIWQDIYSLGATLIYLFTGITPIKFNTKATKSLLENLTFFIRDETLAAVLANSVHPNPIARPAVPAIVKSLIAHQEQLQKNPKSFIGQSYRAPDYSALKQTILAALDGITKAPVVSVNELWYSKKITVQNSTSPKNKQYAKYMGLGEGMLGPLYMLARLHKAGINIGACSSQITKGWHFIEQEYFTKISELSPGLFKGAAGLALALAESIDSGLIENDAANSEIIQNCLNISNDKLDLANGVAGQGLSILHCLHLTNTVVSTTRLESIIDRLLKSQSKKDTTWLQCTTAKCTPKNSKVFDLGYDDTGIIWFLLEYIAHYPNSEVQNAVDKSLKRMLRDETCMKYFYRLAASRDSYELGDGAKGMIQLLLKAYETLHEGVYRKTAELALSKYPQRIVNTNFSQQSGLAAVGELYLDAWRVFGNEKWKNQSEWIANVFLHTFFKNKDDSGYWIMEENNPPTADLLTGTSGIIHFLARCLHPEKIGYRILK